MFTSTRTKAIQYSSLHEKLFLCAVTIELHYSGLLETSFEKVSQKHRDLCTQFDVEPLPSYSDLSLICSRLGSFKILVVEDSTKDLEQKILLNVSSDDLSFALTNCEIAKKILSKIISFD